MFPGYKQSHNDELMQFLIKLSTDKKNFQLQFGPMDYCIDWDVCTLHYCYIIISVESHFNKLLLTLKNKNNLRMLLSMLIYLLTIITTTIGTIDFQHFDVYVASQTHQTKIS